MANFITQDKDGNVLGIQAPDLQTAQSRFAQHADFANAPIIPAGTTDLTDQDAMDTYYYGAYPSRKPSNTQDQGSLSDQIRAAQIAADPSLDPANNGILNSIARGAAKLIVPHAYESAMAGNPDAQSTAAGLLDVPNLAANALSIANPEAMGLRLYQTLAPAAVGAGLDYAAQKAAGSSNPSATEMVLSALGSAMPFAGAGTAQAMKNLGVNAAENFYKPSIKLQNSPNAPDFNFLLKNKLQPYMDRYGSITNINEASQPFVDAANEALEAHPNDIDLSQYRQEALDQIQSDKYLTADSQNKIIDNINRLFNAEEEKRMANIPAVTHDEQVPNPAYAQQVYMQNMALGKNRAIMNRSTELDPRNISLLDVPPVTADQTMTQTVEDQPATQAPIINPSDLWNLKTAYQDEAYSNPVNPDKPLSRANEAIAGALKDALTQNVPAASTAITAQAPYQALKSAISARQKVGGSNPIVSLKDLLAAVAGPLTLGTSRLFTTPGGGAMLYDASKYAPYALSAAGQGLHDVASDLGDTYGVDDE